MSKANQTSVARASANGKSAFIRPTLNRGLAILGTSGLVIGLGITSSTPAVANGIECTDGNTVTQGESEAATQGAIEDILEAADTVCLSGDIVISETLYFTKNIKVKGDGEASIETLDSGGVFLSDESEEFAPLHEIYIENLSIRNAGSFGNPDPAVFGSVVEIIDSTFEGNSYGAIIGRDVTVSNSTFVNNSSDDFNFFNGGAIRAELTVSVFDSTFVNNRAGNGGAIYATTVSIQNSTFLNNSADDEGGAIYAQASQVFYSTFVDNLAANPPDDPADDIPGNAIYKTGTSQFRLGANIFAGSSPHPQLGYGGGGPPEFLQFTDRGANVFSTLETTETDIIQDPSTKFGRDLASLFGTDSPSLDTHAPNENGTQTIALIAGSPALNAVPLSLFDALGVLFDQRGEPRTHPADAGAFEGFVSRNLATTGTASPWWAAWYSAAILAIGGLAVAYAKRTRRRIR